MATVAIECHTSGLVGPPFEPVAELLTESAGVGPGDLVLAVGSDDALARAAAARGAHVRAVHSALDGLPFADDEFDHVLSAFGVATPHPRPVVRELVRVARPAATVAFTAWGQARAFRSARHLLRDLEVAEESLGASRYLIFSGHK